MCVALILDNQIQSRLKINNENQDKIHVMMAKMLFILIFIIFGNNEIIKYCVTHLIKQHINRVCLGILFYLFHFRVWRHHSAIGLDGNLPVFSIVSTLPTKDSPWILEEGKDSNLKSKLGGRKLDSNPKSLSSP